MPNQAYSISPFSINWGRTRCTVWAGTAKPTPSKMPLSVRIAVLMPMTSPRELSSGIFEGVGFAVPAQTVQRVLPQLIEKGEMEYAWLGITSLASEEGLGVAALAEPLQLPVTQGVLIDTIVPESPAAKAGLQGGNEAKTVRGVTVCAGGDIIVAVNGLYVKNMDELLSFMVLNTNPGDVLTMLVIRGSDTFELPLTLEPRPTTFSSPQVLCGG